MNIQHKKSRGFGLVEVLITIGILSVGISGVMAFHSVVTRQSLDNKTRVEALSIAQSRIEEMRNYTDTANTLAGFNTLYANTTGFANSTTVNGVSTVFTRDEQITASGNLKDIVVRVNWSDPDGDAQSLSLNTDIGFVSPRSAGDTALEASESLVDAPTGRARLGEGELPEGAETTDNGDGTALFQDGSEELRLVFDDQIVLTLSQACQTEEGTCIDFVKIKGTIFIDTSSQNNLDPGDVYVVASDAAFCARHWTDGGTTYSVTRDTASTITTPGGDYEYFDYTCYLGGGWHGNVGVLLAGGISQSDKVCIGDPVSINEWQAPIIATRRAYRGMLFKYDAGTDSGKEEYIDLEGDSLIRYYSHGIADQTEFPVPETEQAGHDFVIGSMNANETDGDACITEEVLTQPDSNTEGEVGDMFAGMPTDFVCLNDGYLDAYDDSEFGNTSTCPYDPSDPPSTRHILEGYISVLAPDTDVNDDLVESVTTLTSDGPGNCLVGTFSYVAVAYQANYECDVFDWGNGWNGYIEVQYDASSMSCNPNRLLFSDVTADDSGNHFLNCSPGSFAVISGTVSASGNRHLDAAVLSDGGACTVAGDGLSYSCVTNEFVDATWTGSITFTPSNGAACTNGANGVRNFTAINSGYITSNLIIANNAGQCP